MSMQSIFRAIITGLLFIATSYAASAESWSSGIRQIPASKPKGKRR